MANLFTSQTPVVTDASDGSPGITVGTTEVFSAAGTVPAIYFYATATVSGTYTVSLYTVDASDPGTGTLLASKTMAGAPTAGTWNRVVFDSAVSVTTGVAYRATVFSGAGRYVATLNFPEFVGGAGGLTNGNAFAPPNNDNPVGAITINQGTFLINAAAGYPTSSGNASCYFVAADYVVAGAPAVVPTGLSIPVSLGAPTATYQLEAAPASLAVPVSLGQPTTRVSGVKALPASLAIPLALGAPEASQPVRTPTSLTIPISLGEPTVTYQLEAAPASLAVPITLGAPAIRFKAIPAGLSIPISLGQPTVTRVSEAGGGWSTLRSVIESARQDAVLNAERRRHPIECPVDGWPLEQNSAGVLHCPFGGHIITPSW